MTNNTTHKAGNFIVSIGRDGHQLAIMSAHTGKWVDLKRAKTNKRLRKVKRLLKNNLVDENQFFFEFVIDDEKQKVIEILKGK